MRSDDLRCSQIGAANLSAAQTQLRFGHKLPLARHAPTKWATDDQQQGTDCLIVALYSWLDATAAAGGLSAL